MSKLGKFLQLIPNPIAQVVGGAVEIITSKEARDDNKTKVSTKAALPVAATSGAGCFIYLDMLPPEERAIATAIVTIVSYLLPYLFRLKK